MTVVSSPRPRPAPQDDTLWSILQTEARSVVAREPAMGILILTTILQRSSFEEAVAQRIAARLGSRDVPASVIVDAFSAAIADDPTIAPAMRADILAVIDRDPATERLIEPLLYFKGYHALQAHRIAHWLWTRGRTDLALWLQSRSSAVFQTDIHPNARLGKGIFLDHATGLVVGATCIIDDDVSLLQDVTLGGTGKETGDRHPRIRSGVMIGSGAKILGAIEVGAGSRVAAGSVVLRPVAPGTTVAGVPAREVGAAGGDSSPARDMNQLLGEIAYRSFDYVI